VSAPAALFFEEDFRKAEATAGEFLGIIVSDEGHTFLADFREVDFPRELGEQLGIEFRALALLMLAGRLVLSRGLWGNLFLRISSGFRLSNRILILGIVAFSLLAAAFALRIVLRLCAG